MKNLLYYSAISTFIQSDYRINSISELSNLLGIELTEKNY